MRATRCFPFFALVMMAGTAAQGESTDSAVREIETERTATDITSPEEEARRWGVTVEEYRRYQEALLGPRGRLSVTNISPIEVLGIEATTTAERDRYAEMWVKMIRADTGKALAFTRSVHNAWERLHPDEPLIDRHAINLERAKGDSRWGPIPLKDDDKVGADDQLLLFTKAACDSCNVDVQRLVKQLEGGAYAGLDIYVLDVGEGDIAAVQGWAAALAIPPHLVHDGAITLNFDRGALQTLTNSLQFTPSSMPVIMRKRGQDYDLVSQR